MSNRDEDTDEELADAELLIESMIEIENNKTLGRDGHDEDPFDRTNEYDVDVDLESHHAMVTPDIPAATLIERVDVEKLKDKVDQDGMESGYMKTFPVAACTWVQWVEINLPWMFENVQKFVDATSSTNNDICDNHLELTEKLKLLTNDRAAYWNLLNVQLFDVVYNAILQIIGVDNNLANSIIETMELQLLTSEFTNPNKDNSGHVPASLKCENMFKEIIQSLMAKLSNKTNINEKDELVIRFIGVILESLRWKTGKTTELAFLRNYVIEEFSKKGFESTHIMVQFPFLQSC